MYLGEGKFYQERMGEFIKVAKDLEVKEMIIEGVEIPEEEKDIIEDDIPEDDIEETLQEENQSQVQRPTPRPARSHLSTDTKSTKCPECGAEFTANQSMLRHYRSKHEGIKYP